MVLSELHLALIGAGAAAVAAIWAYTGWQDRQQRKKAEILFKGEQADVLLPESDKAGGEPDIATTSAAGGQHPMSERVEPRIGGLSDDQAAAVQDVADQAPPLAADMAAAVIAAGADPASAPAADHAAIIPAGSEPPATNDPTAEMLQPQYSTAAAPAVVMEEDISPADRLADCVVRFRSNTALQASGIWAAQRAWSATLSKPTVWLGRNPGDAAWVVLNETAAGSYSDYIAALPLADRRGPVSEAEVVAFIDGLRKLGEHLNCAIDLPDAEETLLRATAIDQFCASVDVQFSLQVVESGGGVFVGTKLRGVCEAAGLTWAADGCFHAIDDQGEELFRLANIGNTCFPTDGLRATSTYGVVLTIDVPRVSDGTTAFNKMLLCAQQLARGMGGVLVDAQRVPLSEAMIDKIRAKIGELHKEMKGAEIVPGSPRALKLFS